MARRKDQAARRSQLVAATMESIATLGIEDTTLNSVAARARISPRLIAYYYESLDQLIEAAHESATEHFYGSRREALATDDPPTVKLARLIGSGLPRDGETLVSQVLNELSVSGARRSSHARLMARLFEQETSLYVDVLTEGAESGEFALSGDPLVLAHTFVALEDGLGLHLLGAQSAVDAAAAEQVLVGFVRAATGVSLDLR